MLGYTATHGINPALHRLAYDPVTDFAPVGLIGYSPTVVVAGPGLPAGSVEEVVAQLAAEPGRYTIGVSLRTEEIDVTAPPFALRIASPRSWDEEWIAQELFTDEVGRALAFGGTTAMVRALDALRNVTDRLPDRAVARHARLALALAPRGRND